MRTATVEGIHQNHFGGAKLKRVSVSIQNKKRSETAVIGYALSHEITGEGVSFFAAQKFPIEEELELCYSLHGEKKTVTVVMKSMHEQISSGKVMTTLPTEENPFPARTFYRCYSSIVGASAKTGDSTVEAETSAQAPTEAPADTLVAAPEEEQKAA